MVLPSSPPYCQNPSCEQTLTEVASIRSLLTDDLKRRRLSGRHQISYDGKHLVDGIAFGRPWLRTPHDRPAITLPPRKRARITYDPEDDDYEEADEDQQEALLLHGSGPFSREQVADSSALDIVDYPSDDEADHEFTPENESESDEDADAEYDDDDEQDNDAGDLSNEARELEDEQRLHRQTRGSKRKRTDKKSPKKPRWHAFEDIIKDLGFGDCLMILQTAFPLTSTGSIAQEITQNNLEIRTAYKSLSKSNEPALSYDEMLDRWLEENIDLDVSSEIAEATPKQPSRPLIEVVDSINSTVKSPSSAKKADAKIQVIEEEDETSSSASSSESSDDSNDDTSESDAESRSLRKRKVIEAKSPVSSGSSDEDSDSSSESDDTSESDDNPLKPQVKSKHRDAQGNEDASSGSSSESDSESDSDSDSSFDSSSDSDSDSDTSSDSSSNEKEKGAHVKKGASADHKKAIESSRKIAPGRSDSDTKIARSALVPRNNARSAGKDVQPTYPHATTSEAFETTVRPGQGLSKTQKRNARRREAKRHTNLLKETSEMDVESTVDDIKQQLLARKQALLGIVSGENESPQEPQVLDTSATKQPLIQDVTSEEPTTQNQPLPAAIATPELNEPSPKDGSESRRMRIDLGAGRRLLFGALGLRNPKTKADENQIKTQLMKDVRPLKNHREEPLEESEEAVREVEEKNDNWREKINYRAVECCQEGIVLSEPPFPFVQRWDPQQRFDSIRKRKRRSQGYQGSAYDVTSELYEPTGLDDTTGSSKKKRRSTHLGGNEDDNAGNVDVLNYDDIPAVPDVARSQSPELEDLPSLPSDVSSLPLLQAGELKPGMVITWKTLLLSKATNWQPQLVSTTGMVISAKDGSSIHVILAKRDREYDERLYDAETGKRIYDKFEAPDQSGDEEEQVDDGHRDLNWAEMTEPRLVQAEPPKSASDTSKKATAGSIWLDALDQNASAGGEDANADNANSDSEESVSIQSGQQVPHLEMSVPSIGPSIHAQSRSEESLNRSIVQETAAEGDKNHQASQHDLQPSKSSESVAKLSSYELEPSQVADSQAEFELLAAPSDIGSIPSGQQLQPNHELPDSLDQSEEVIIPETNLSAHELASQGRSDDESSACSNTPACPSVDEIWQATQDSKQSQGSNKLEKSSSKAKKGKVKNEQEYETVMRKLDEGEDTDRSNGKIQSARNLFSHASQPLPSAKPARSLTPIKAGLRRSKRRSSPLEVVPAGSQIIARESSPGSSPPRENPAEDSADGSKERNSSKSSSTLESKKRGGKKQVTTRRASQGTVNEQTGKRSVSRARKSSVKI
jgi:hypothetical protein